MVLKNNIVPCPPQKINIEEGDCGMREYTCRLLPLFKPGLQAFPRHHPLKI